MFINRVWMAWTRVAYFAQFRLRLFLQSSLGLDVTRGAGHSPTLPDCYVWRSSLRSSVWWSDIPPRAVSTVNWECFKCSMKRRLTCSVFLSLNLVSGLAFLAMLKQPRYDLVVALAFTTNRIKFLCCRFSKPYTCPFIFSHLHHMHTS